jgi:hypothetical protein
MVLQVKAHGTTSDQKQTEHQMGLQDSARTERETLVTGNTVARQVVKLQVTGNCYMAEGGT